jgi:hypothetical protein
MDRVSGIALLELLEPGWRIQLRDGRLAGELGIEPEVREAAARALGQASRARPAQELAHHWPACVVVALAQVATACYRRGAFWSGWQRACGPGASRRAADWSRAFVDALAVLGVPAPPCDPETAMLVHMALPSSCLDEVLRRQALDAELGSADPAVLALRDHGGAAAESLLDRCATLVQLLRTWEDDLPAQDMAELRLPARIVDAARQVASDLPQARAAVRLDPYGRGVLLAGEEHSAAPEEVVDATDPLLLFDEEGAAVSGALPPETVWALYPEHRQLCADVPPRVLVAGGTPLGWQGWRLVLIALDHISWLALDGADARRRLVRGRSRARLVAGPALPGVTTPAGLPVHATLPALRLPAGEGRWRVEVRRATGGPVLTRVESTAADWEPTRLWAAVRRPVLGELVVSARPPDGADAQFGLRRTVAVAEGLAVRYSPEMRLTHAQGVEPAEAVLPPVPGLTVAPHAVAFAPWTERVEVRCVAGPVVRTLVLTPPRCRTRVEAEPGDGSAAAAWHTLGPLRLDLADVRSAAALHLDLPGIAYHPPLDVVAGNEVVQRLEPSRLGRYPLRRLLDTVAVHGGAELCVTVAGRTSTVVRLAAPAPGPDPWLPAPSVRTPARAP